MDEYINGIKNKYGYSEELTNFLSQLIPTLIKYYGEEHKNTILSALSDCEIHFQSKEENPKTYLNSYFGVNKEWEMPPTAKAFYHKEISVKDNKVVSKSIIYSKSVFSRIVYNPFDFSDDKQLNTLIHEICHLVKGYGKLKVENGKIIDSTGLAIDTYSYSQETGVVEEKNEMLGIEEALNDVEAAQILEMITGRKQEIGAYKVAGYHASRLLEHKDIVKVIRSSQFNGDSNWIRYLGEEQSKVLIDNFDVLVNSLYVSYSDINTKEKKKAYFEKIDLAQDALNNFIDNYCSKEDVEVFMQSLANADKKTIEMIQQMNAIKQNTNDVSGQIRR